MSTPTDEIKIDLAEADRAQAELDAKKNAKPEEKDGLQVVDAEAEAKPVERTILKPEEGLEKLKKQLEDERAARADADRRAAESAEAERVAKTEVQGSQLDLVTNAIATVTQSNDVLEGKYAEALAAQDFAAAAKINREMSTNSAKLLQLENGKASLEKAPKPQTRTSQDPVDKYVAAIPTNYPRSREWVRSHPEYVKDAKKNDEMLAAHRIAVSRGHAPDSDGYFKSIEKTLEIEPEQVEQIQEVDVTSEAAKPVRRAPPAAPVTRSGNGAGNRSNVVTLTAAEREMASNMGMSDLDYAKNKFALKKEGRLN